MPRLLDATRSRQGRTGNTSTSISDPYPRLLDDHALERNRSDMTRRLIDDGGVIQFWRGLVPSKEGYAVTTAACDNPDCTCSNLYLYVSRFQPLEGDLAKTGEQLLSGIFHTDSGEVELEEGKADGEIREWLLGCLIEDKERLAERFRRSRAQVEEEEPLYLPEDWQSGDMVLYADVFPNDWNVCATHEGRRLVVFDNYCPKRRCYCNELRVNFHDLTPGIDIGHVVASLEDGKVKERDGKGAVTELWAQVLDDQGIEFFRERRRRLFHLRPRTPAKVHLPTVNVGRNDPCPCRSGKKYKRCCLGKS